MKIVRHRQLGSVAGLALLFTAPVAASALATANWAVVDANSTVARQSHVASTMHIGTGMYFVDFLSDVTKCAYIATPGDTGAGALTTPLLDTVAWRSGDPNGVFVQAFDQSTDASVDAPFHLRVYCGKEDLYAVVAFNGLLARGHGVISSQRVRTGRYTVTFAQSVTKCAYIAGIGAINSGQFLHPGVITAAPGASDTEILLRVVDRTGVPVDSPFHLVADCGATDLIAAIRKDGTKKFGADVLSSGKIGGIDSGTYEVIFDRTVSGCAYSATTDSLKPSRPIKSALTITTATRTANPSGVFVFVHKTDGSTIDEPFHLALAC